MRFASLVSVVVLLLISASLVFATNGFQVQEDNLSVLVAVEDGTDFNCFDTETPEHNLASAEAHCIDQHRQMFSINSQAVDNYGVTADTVSHVKESAEERTRSLTELRILLENSSEDIARNGPVEANLLECTAIFRTFAKAHLGTLRESTYCRQRTTDAYGKATGHRVLKYPSSVLLLV